ncbi:inositol hexaphosphate kinase Kcs1 [Aspergillus violaceofuscus CBS 115571]|uniref:Kinase n=1 Tax=Aspergillus violaceofuscus (strain CBS 115571) TaxID=1450538 RepID=A0A2V5IDE6_ASPV1|nr:inositol hexaphosphate kinase Kcs1 [Aspergillus violaceofuscus CBS 115571]
MSRPPSATDNTWSGPLVTPDSSAQYDCSEGPDLPRDQQRRHNDTRSQLIHQDAQQAPSPSRAESPTAHQWAKPTSTFPLKRPTAAPVERLSRPDRSHSPQLSERDSIFATHYLPSETDPSTTPRLSPSEDTNHEPPASLTPLLEDVSAFASSDSPHKVIPRSNRVGTSHMEVDVRRKHPLDTPSLLPPAVPHSTPLLPVDSDAIVDEHSGLAHRSAPFSAWESLQPLRKVFSDGAANKPAASADHLAHRSLLSASLNDAPLPPLPPLHSSVSSPGVHSPVTSVDTAHHAWSMSQPHEGARENRLERSSSRSRRGRVEQSIEANLANAEPASHVRSRKSSHYLGLFKENTTSPDRKRREERAGRHDDPAELNDPHHRVTHSEPRFALEHCDSPLEASFPSDEGELRNTKSLSQLSLADAPLILPSIESDISQMRHGDNVKKSQPRALPRSLLEEIRNFHLTPGGARGTSFSRSIPTQFAERGRDYFSKDHASHGIPGSHLSGSDSDREQRRPLEEEEDEQISSAVYFPHERVTISEEVDSIPPYADNEHGGTPIDISTAQNGHIRMPKRHVSDDLEGNHVDISLRSKNESRILHGDLQGMQSAPIEELNEESLASIPERTTDYYSTCESEFASADDSGLSVRDEESSLTDEADVTPTATPTQGPRFPRARRKHSNAAPLGAVELKPYRHQVGGHTTVFRFSRRAVCKQLNNRENEFYERIERRHPEMLMFLPRYIGVLNVTFSKTPKRPKDLTTTNGEHRDTNHTANNPHPADNKGSTAASSSCPSKDTNQPRIFSQKQVTGIIPQVILENNRHIIPADLFSHCQRPRTADGSMTQRRFSTGIESMSSRQNGQECLADGPLSPQVLKKKQWGATTVNRQLQEQVLREVFSPPAVHHHRRHARGHLNLPRTSSDGIRRRVNLSEDRALSRRTASVEDAPTLAAGIDIVKQTNDGPGLSSSASTALDAGHNRLEKVRTEESPQRASSLSRTRPMRRRRSGSGLQRRGSLGSVEGGGELLFFDDDGYGGDKEDGVFPMEGDISVKSPAGRRMTDQFGPPLPNPKTAVAAKPVDQTLNEPSEEASRHGDHLLLPSNPKEAQTRKDDRVQFFLLLEDLTAGMNKPCVLDLKMGTRQYGIEADEKKRKSQRRKCQSTTSQQLGVRLCGMQTWNVKKQEYSFEDKYFGRDLKAGREFQDALTRFLYDGASQRSVTKKIPVILEKLARLENMIRRLKRYRLYASSLLILYDGDPNPTEGATQVNGRSGSGTMRDHLQRRSSDDGYPDVQLKIVDFANCVTGEDEISPDASCPPQHPDDIDRGYLRGLRTLRMYFQRILKEVSHDDYIERGEGEAIALGSRHSDQDESSERFWDENVMESDPGEVSF